MHIGYPSCCSKLEFLTQVEEREYALGEDAVAFTLVSHTCRVWTEHIVVHATCVPASIVTLQLTTLVDQTEMSKCVRCRLCKL